VRELEALERFLPDEALDREASGAVSRLRAAGAHEEEGAEPAGGEIGSSMRAVAPPVQSFAAGRRR